MDRILIRRRNSLTVLMLVLCFCMGWLSACPIHAYSVILLFAPSIVMTLILITISQIKNQPIIQSFQWLILLIWPLAFPVYMIRFYRWKGLVIVGLSLLAYALSIHAGYYLALFATR